jgi:hypothetical protein
MAGNGPVGRRAFVAASLAVLVGAAAGLRIGSPGSMGELFPTLFVAVATAAAVGATTSLAWLGGARVLLALVEAQRKRAKRLDSTQVLVVQQKATDRHAFLSGEDLDRETREADDSVLRLVTAIHRLSKTRDALATQLASLDDEEANGELGRELQRATDDVGTKLELGGKILSTAEATAFRIACSAPVKGLLRRRPKDPVKALEGQESVEPALLTLRAFLVDADSARARLTALEGRRPKGDLEDPWTLAMRDVDAVRQAYGAVVERLLVVRVRLTAEREMNALAEAAGDVSNRAASAGLDARELSDLVSEISRAEMAITMATPDDRDAQTLTLALARSTLALDRSDGESIDDLLRAMRELA